MIQVDFQKVQNLAAERGLNIAELAQRLNYKSPQALYSIKQRSAVHNKTAFKIAQFFGVKVADISIGTSGASEGAS